MSTKTTTVLRLDDETFWAVQSIRDHLCTTAEHLAPIEAHLARAVRLATVAGSVVAGAAVVAAAALVVGEVRR